MTKIPKLDSNNNEVIVEHKSTRKTNSISRPDYDYELKELHPFISSIGFLVGYIYLFFISKPNFFHLLPRVAGFSCANNWLLVWREGVLL